MAYREEGQEFRSFPSEPGSVGSLALALMHAWNPERLFVLVTVYIDESGTHDSPLMTMAGLVGRLGQWATFDAKWKAMLAKDGIEFYHAKKMIHGQDQFRGWSQARKEASAKQVNKIIQRHSQFGFTLVLKDDEYRDHYQMPGVVRPRKLRLDSRYGLCFRMCLAIVPDLVRQTWSDHEIDLHFVLESGHKNYGDAERVFHEVKEDNQPNISNLLRTISSGSKREFPGLQGADVPAHVSFGFETSGDVPVVDLGGPHMAAEMMSKKSSLKKAPTFRYHIKPETLREVRRLQEDDLENRKRKRSS